MKAVRRVNRAADATLGRHDPEAHRIPANRLRFRVPASVSQVEDQAPRLDDTHESARAVAQAMHPRKGEERSRSLVPGSGNLGLQRRDQFPPAFGAGQSMVCVMSERVHFTADEARDAGEWIEIDWAVSRFDV